MPLLKIDKDKCKECNNCEKLLPTFRSKYDGELFISWAKLRDNVHVRKAVNCVIAECKNNAISLRPG